MALTFTNLEFSVLKALGSGKVVSYKKLKRLGVNLDAVFCLIHQFKEQLVIEVEGAGYQITDAGQKALEQSHG